MIKMTQDFDVSYNDITVFGLDLTFEDDKIDIKELFQKTDINGLRHIQEVIMNKINDEKYSIRIESTDIITDENKKMGPFYQIILRKNQMRFSGAPFMREIKYKEILDKINVDGNNLLLNFFKNSENKLKIKMVTDIYFEIKDTENF